MPSARTDRHIRSFARSVTGRKLDPAGNSGVLLGIWRPGTIGAMMEHVQLTDPALEIAALATELSRLPDSQSALHETLSGFFSVGTGDPEFLEIVSILRRRIAKLDEIASNLSDADFSAEQREQVRAGLARLAVVFNAAQFPNSWSQARRHARADDALALMWFSQIVRRHRPLKVLSDSERTELLARLEELIPEVEAAPEISGWNRDVLIDGLSSLRTRIRYIKFFGTEQISADLIVVERLTNLALYEARSTSSEVNFTAPDEPSALGKLAEWAKYALMTMTIIAAPDQAITALGNYKQLFEAHLVYSGKPAPPKQLPAPEMRALPARKARPEDDAERARENG